jgi:hypothetical protein
VSAAGDDTGQTQEQRAAQLVTRADQRGYERGKAEAVSAALTGRAAGVVLRAQADALTTLAKTFGTTVPPASAALTNAAAGLRAQATKLGG